MIQFPDDMDSECIPICTAINRLAGLRTVESCCGHGERPHRIFFIAETIHNLLPVVRAADSSAWKVEVFWSNGVDVVMFMLEGPIGPAHAPGGANEFASWLDSQTGDTPG
jgi:hypothetical protein